jgi:hypothetical protein
MKRFALAALSVATLSLSVVSNARAIHPLDFSTLTGSNTTGNAVLVAEANLGEFVTVEQDHATTGTAEIVTENGQTYVVFDEAFDTARGPDVVVVLHQGADVPVKLAEENYVTLASLQSFDGAQRYLIPAEIDVDAYDAVAIWCRQFNVTFGYATL